MSLVRIRATGEVVLRSVFAKTLPNVSLADNLTDYEFNLYGFDEVKQVPQPNVEKFENVKYLGVVQLEDGSFAQGWEVTPMEQDEIDEITTRELEQLRSEAKAERQALVDLIVVDINGKKFDGDETSQNRMSRAILALESAGRTSTNWMLHDNQFVEVTLDELKLALQAAGEEQTRLWAI